MTAKARPRWCRIDGSVWCETDGCVHDDSLDPYSYGTSTNDEGEEVPYVCPGPHRPLYAFGQPEEF